MFRARAVEARLQEDLGASVQSGVSRLAWWGLGVLAVALLVGLIPFEQVVEVQGVVRLAGADAMQRSTFAGTVKAVPVQVGTHVVAGQLLVQLTTPELEGALQRAQGDEATALQAGPAARLALEEGRARLQSEEAALSLANGKIRRAESRLAAQKTLVADGLAPRQAIADAEDQVAQATLDREQMAQTISSTKADLANLRQKADQAGAPERTSLEALQRQASEMAVHAGQSGVVEWIGVHEGEAVVTGQRLVRVIPDGSSGALEVAVLLPVDKLGELRSGQSARVALDGFMPGDFGYGEATLKRVGRDLLSPDDVREISLAAPAGKAQVEGVMSPTSWKRLHPEAGMSLRAWIVMGRRSLLSRLWNKLD